MTSGVYKITNKINGKCYVGSAVSIERRWKEHKRGSHSNPHLQAAMAKYGVDNFDYSILKRCIRLVHWEQHYIDTLQPEYNFSRVAGRIEMTDEVRQKISAKLTGNKQRSDKMKVSMLGNTNALGKKFPGRHWTEERKQRHSDLMKGNKFKHASWLSKRSIPDEED